MTLLQDVSTGIHGALKLARLDPRGMLVFDRTLAECRRSFMAGVILYPVALAFIIFNADPQVWAKTGVFPILAIESISYVVHWCFFPLAVLPLCVWLGRGPLYPGFITAYNWAQVVETGVAAIVVLAVTAGLLPEEMRRYFDIVIFFASLFYEGFIARAALRATAPMVTAIVLLDCVTTLAIGSFTSSLY